MADAISGYASRRTGAIRMGSVVVSVDAELGWGYHDLDAPPPDRVEAARTGWERLVDRFDRFDVPATWAVVGHLLLDECDGRHTDHPAPDGWFARERTEWSSRPDLRFARGLVDELLDGAVEHDIGCHSFSHVDFAASETSRELARAEVRASVAAARDRGIRMESFVFPRNQVDHRDVLADSPLTCYRGTSPIRSSGPLRPLRKLSRATLGREFLVEPRIDEYGLVNVPRSMYLFGFEGMARSAVEPFVGDPIVRQVRQGIDQAARTDGLFHVSLHPNDLTAERTVRRIETVLAAIDERRDETPLAVETMRDVAERVLAADASDAGPSR